VVAAVIRSSVDLRETGVSGYSEGRLNGGTVFVAGASDVSPPQYREHLRTASPRVKRPGFVADYASKSSF
jgi:hypothetical protein